MEIVHIFAPIRTICIYSSVTICSTLCAVYHIYHKEEEVYHMVKPYCSAERKIPRTVWRAVTISHICQCVCHSGGAAHTPKTIMAKNPLKCTLLYFWVLRALKKHEKGTHTLNTIRNVRGAHTPKTIMAKNPRQCTLLHSLVSYGSEETREV